MHALDPYQDTGCKYWRACLACPFPRCVEEWESRRAGYLAQRDAAIRLLHRRGWPVAALAAAFGMHRRSVYKRIGPAEGRAA